MAWLSEMDKETPFNVTGCGHDFVAGNLPEKTRAESAALGGTTCALVARLWTVGSGMCGLIAIAFASKVTSGESNTACDMYFAVAGWFIMAAMVFDMFDGYVARLSKTASKFGGELDSLCDAISFGVAPAFLLLRMGPGWQPEPLLHQLLACIAALYMICAVLRLAPLKVEMALDPAGPQRFRGLPSPAPPR